MEKMKKSAESFKASPSGVPDKGNERSSLEGAIKKIMGLIWMLLAPVIIFFLVNSAVHNIGSGGTKDINQPVPWIIIITIFTPIAIGLMIFGYYAFKGEYDKLPESSEEI